MTIFSLRRWSILILALTLAAATAKFHLQTIQESGHAPHFNIIQDDQTQKYLKATASLMVEKDAEPQNVNTVQQNTTFSMPGFNGATLVRDQHVYFINNGQSCLFWKLELKTMKLKQVDPCPFPNPYSSYEILPNFSMYTPPKFMDLKNGDIALSYFRYLCILNNETFELKQVLNGHNTRDNIKQFYSYQDPFTNSSTTLVCRQPGMCVASELIKLSSGEYVANEITSFLWLESDFFSTPSFSVFLTGLNTAVYLDDCTIKYINTLQNILDVSYDPKYYLYGRVKLAVSYDESFFVLKTEDNTYEFYEFGEDYQVALKHSVKISGQSGGTKKGETTSDNAYLFVSILKSIQQSDVARINTKTGDYKLIAGQQRNKSLIDFNIFEAKYDRFVTIERRGSKNYFLQLRTISNLTVISEIPLLTDLPIVGYKLIGSITWGVSFAVAQQIRPYQWDIQNDTKLFLFKVEEDRIISVEISQDASMSLLAACDKYIISYKRFNPLRVLHFSNLSQAKVISTPDSTDYEYIHIEKSILLLHNPFPNFDLYDFGKSTQKQGSFYGSHYGFSSGYDYWLIMAKRELLYKSSIYLDINQEPATKVIYNISYLPIQRQTVFQKETDGFYCQYAMYLLNPKENCNFILYLNYLINEDKQFKGPAIIKYYECSKKREQYPIQESEQYIYKMNFISSDKKYFIVLLRHSTKMELLLEIRPINNLSKVYFRKIFGYFQSQWTYLQRFSIDILKDNIVLIRSPEFMTVYLIETKDK